MSDHLHISVRLNKFHTLTIFIYTYIYIKKDALIKNNNNQAVLIYHRALNISIDSQFSNQKILSRISSNIESCYNCYSSYQFIKTCRSVDVEGHSSKK